MTTEPSVEVHRVLPQGGAGTFTEDEAMAILEVAYLATAADDRLSDEELDAFEELKEHLAGLVGEAPKGALARDLEDTLDGFAGALERDQGEGRLKAVAKVLGRPLAKDTAYKVSFAMALSDLGANDEESDFDAALVEALSLSDEAADELASQVYEALEVDGEEEEDA